MNFIQKKLIGSIIIVVIVLALIIWLAVLPLVGKIKYLSQEYLSNQGILAQIDQKEFLFKDLEKDYQEIEDELLIIKGVFLEKEKIVSFIPDLESIAKFTGNIFEITTVMSSSDEEENREKFLSLNISLRGDFKNLLLFLSNLKDSPYSPYRLLEIDKLSINRLDDEEDYRLETNLRIKVYTK